MNLGIIAHNSKKVLIEDFCIAYKNILAKRCDQYNIPVATNIATAELLILGLARGDLDWRLNLK